jgi:site-specific recombinase XerD
MEDSLEVKLVICPNAHSDSMTVLELVQRYLMLKKGVKPNTLSNYKFIVNALKKDPFSPEGHWEGENVRCQIWLIKMQSEGKGYSIIHSIRGVVRPAFQMAVDDEILWRNPFNFEMKDVLINDSVRREALSKRDMRIFLEFIRKDEYFKRYYEGIYILFHTGLRISEFCGLTVNDIDLESGPSTWTSSSRNPTVNITSCPPKPRPGPGCCP